MQEKLITLLREQFPMFITIKSDDKVKLAIPNLDGNDLEKLKVVEGMYVDILIESRKDCIGLLLTFTF